MSSGSFPPERGVTSAQQGIQHCPAIQNNAQKSALNHRAVRDPEQQRAEDDAHLPGRGRAPLGLGHRQTGP